MERVSFSPGEFAALFGKSQTWGYRQIYAGKVKTITEYGRIQIPAAEVERILATAGTYHGLKKQPRSKKDFESLKTDLQSAWQAFVSQKRAAGSEAKNSAGKIAPPAPAIDGTDKRKAALKRLAGGKVQPLRKWPA